MAKDIPAPKYELTIQILEIIGRGHPYRATLQKFLPCSVNQPYEAMLFDFEVVGICQKPILDIKPIEPIEIRIAEGHMPDVFVLRNDFPAVPHLMMSDDGKTKWICYSAVADEELRLRMNGRFLVECINNWFVKTARNDLHHPDQPFEPFFLGSKGVAIVKSGFNNKMFNKFVLKVNKEQKVLFQVDDKIKDSNSEWYITLLLQLPPSADNIIRRVPSTLMELLKLVKNVDMLDLFRKQVETAWLVRQNQKLFAEIFGQMTNALLNCKCLIVLYIPVIDDKSNSLALRDLRVFVVDKPYSSLLELIGYRFNSNPKVKKLEPIASSEVQDIPVTLLNLHSSFETAFARQLNGLDDNYENPRIALIGVGALGSQVFANCIRAGYGKWTLIDNDKLWSHNLARHSLGLAAVGKSKAFEMVDYAKSILEDAEVNAIVDSMLNQKNTELVSALAEADIIVDISTSVAVEREIAIGVESKARRVSFFLNQSGTCLAMLKEDTERSITLDLLEMQLYKILTRDEYYRDYFFTTDTTAYSATCRSITSRLSQDDIALSAATVSKELKRLQETNDAQLAIWKITEDGLNATRFAAESWYELKLDQWSIYVNCTLISEMHSKRQEHIPNETGGVLIGHYDFSRKYLYIVDMIFSPNDSIESPTSYIRGCDSLLEKISAISKLSYDNLYYIGEWHSHPTPDTAMSRDDRSLLSVITEWNEAECKLGCMIIVGAEDRFAVHLKTDTNQFSSNAYYCKPSATENISTYS